MNLSLEERSNFLEHAFKHLKKIRNFEPKGKAHRELFEKVKDRSSNLSLQIMIVSELKKFKEEFHFDKDSHIPALQGVLGSEYEQEIEKKSKFLI